MVASAHTTVQKDYHMYTASLAIHVYAAFTKVCSTLIVLLNLVYWRKLTDQICGGPNLAYSLLVDCTLYSDYVNTTRIRRMH